MERNCLPMQETSEIQVGSLHGWEDPLEKEMATSSWKIPGTKGLVDYSSWSRRELDMTEAT